MLGDITQAKNVYISFVDAQICAKGSGDFSKPKIGGM